MKFKIVALAALTFVTAAASLARAENAFHGLLLFGDKTLYASHLPMFHAPHDYQVLMKVSLSISPNGPDALDLYEKAKKAGQTEFTLAPKPFDLEQLIAGHTKTLFFADLYQGHFEKNGIKLGPVVVHIESVIYSSHLTPSDQEQNNYLLFGQDGEYFSAHLINGQPSFDTVMSVSHPFTLPYAITHCRAECPPSKPKLVDDSQLPLTSTYYPDQGATNIPAAGDEIGTVNQVSADIKNVVYFESDDLK